MSLFRSEPAVAPPAGGETAANTPSAGVRLRLRSLSTEICDALTLHAAILGSGKGDDLQALSLRISRALDELADEGCDRVWLIKELHRQTTDYASLHYPADSVIQQQCNRMFKQAALLPEVPATGHLAARQVTAADVEAVSQWVTAGEAGLNLDQLLQTIVNEVAQRSPWPLVGAALLEWDRGLCTFIAQTGWMEDGTQMVWPIQDSLSAEAVQSGCTLMLEDILTDQVYGPRYPLVYRDAVARGYRSVLIVPLEHTSYAMWFCGREPHTYTESEVTYATTIAHCTAIAIRNAQLVHKEQQANLVLKQLSDANARQSAALERMVRDQNLLTKMVLDGQGLTAIAAQITEMLDNPVVLYDKMFHCVVAAGTEAVDPVLSSGTVRPSLGGADPVRALADQHRSLYPVIINPDPKTGMHERRIIMPVVVGEDVLGYLHVLEHRHPLEQLDLLAMRQAAIVVALELMKEKIAWSVEMRLQSDVLSDLLFSQGKEEQLLARTAILGINIARPTQLWLIRETSAAEAGLVSAVLDATSAILREWPGHAVPVLQRGDIVVFYQESSGAASDAAEMGRRLQAFLERQVPGTSLLVGMSGTCEGLADIRQRYKQAKRLLDSFCATGHRRGLVSLQALGVVSLLAREETAQDLMDFAGSVLQVLVEYDRRHTTALIPTLSAFLDHGANLRETARHLFVHLSTLRYRLERVAALTGLNLRDPQDRFKCQLALQVQALFAQTPES